MSDTHPAISSGKVAVITGGASGIGLASAQRLAGLGMIVCIADVNGDELEKARATLGPKAVARQLDVADRDAVNALADEVMGKVGPVAVLMNNAGTGGGGDALSNPEGWSRVLGVNLFGVLHGVQAFGPRMVEAGAPAVIVNTSSKQGITSPPGDTAYNVSKAGVRSLTEGLACTLRNMPGCQVSAHLLVPGFTYTGMIRKRIAEKPAAAWLPEQVADRMLEGLAKGEFYLWCEDNETSRATDEKRILWNALDIIENRPALSRWHPDWKEAFERFMD